MPTAILVDGAFFLRRYRSLCGSQSPAEVARGLYRMCRAHLRPRSARRPGVARQAEVTASEEAPAQPAPMPERSVRATRTLYRIFYYDCPPMTKRAHLPRSGSPIDFSTTPVAQWRLAFFDQLKRLRKVALRLGYIHQSVGGWTLRPQVLKDLLRGRRRFDELHDADFVYAAPQKGVDMRLGLDIASLAYKKQVDQIILVAGDSDFVPAAKLARREGIDFVLDPMWAPIRADLFEHIDGLRSVLPKPSSNR